MLLLLIPAVWLALGVFFVLVCVGAARADTLTATAAKPEEPPRSGSPASRRGSLVRLEDHRRRAMRRTHARL